MSFPRHRAPAPDPRGLLMPAPQKFPQNTRPALPVSLPHGTEVNVPGSSSASCLQLHPCADSCPRTALIFHAHSSNWLPVCAPPRPPPSHQEPRGCSRGSEEQGPQGAAWAKPAFITQIYGRQQVMGERHVERARRSEPSHQPWPRSPDTPGKGLRIGLARGG